MVWVNLLPWREVKLKRVRQRWVLLLALLVLTLIAAGMPTVGIRALNQQYQGLDGFMQGANQRLEEQALQMAALTLEKEGLQRQLTARQQRQHRLERWRRFVLSLPEMMPETLWLSTMAKNAASLTLSGVCQSISDLETFRLQLQTLALAAQVKIGQLSRSPQGNLVFNLLLTLAGEENE